MKRTGRKVKGDVALHHNLGFIQPIQRMQCPDREFRVGGIDQQRKLISEVVIARIFMPRSARDRKALARRRHGCAFQPR